MFIELTNGKDPAHMFTKVFFLEFEHIHGELACIYFSATG